MSTAPAMDMAGVIEGWIGSPSICVVLEVVTFSEPLGIGRAVAPTKLLVAAAVPFPLLVPFAAAVALAAGPLEEWRRVDEAAARELSWVELAAALMVSLGAADAVEDGASARGRMAQRPAAVAGQLAVIRTIDSTEYSHAARILADNFNRTWRTP